MSDHPARAAQCERNKIKEKIFRGRGDVSREPTAASVAPHESTGAFEGKKLGMRRWGRKTCLKGTKR